MKMNGKCRFTSTVLLLISIGQAYAVDKIHVIPNDPVQAMKTLQSSTINSQYWKYLRYYQGQITTKTCALASAAMVMNTLDIEAPFIAEYYPAKQFNQKNFLNEKNSAIRSYKQIEVDGSSLPDLAQMLIKGWGVTVTTYHGSDLKLDEFRKILIDTLSSKDSRVIANYKNNILNSASEHGHFSPVAAYNKHTDEVLIMDVARHYTGPYWVSIEQLHKATNTIDSHSGKSRGLLLIKAQ